MESFIVSKLIESKIVDVLEFKGQLIVATEHGVFIKHDDDVFRPIMFEVKNELESVQYINKEK